MVQMLKWEILCFFYVSKYVMDHNLEKSTKHKKSDVCGKNKEAVWNSVFLLGDCSEQKPWRTF